jgi:hypothetical protein
VSTLPHRIPSLGIVHVWHEVSQIPLEHMRRDARIQFMGSVGLNCTLATHDLNARVGLASFIDDHTKDCHCRYQIRGRFQVREQCQYEMLLLRPHLS